MQNKNHLKIFNFQNLNSNWNQNFINSKLHFPFCAFKTNQNNLIVQFLVSKDDSYSTLINIPEIHISNLKDYFWGITNKGNVQILSTFSENNHIFLFRFFTSNQILSSNQKFQIIENETESQQNFDTCLFKFPIIPSNPNNEIIQIQKLDLDLQKIIDVLKTKEIALKQIHKQNSIEYLFHHQFRKRRIFATFLLNSRYVLVCSISKQGIFFEKLFNLSIPRKFQLFKFISTKRFIYAIFLDPSRIYTWEKSTARRAASFQIAKTSITKKLRNVFVSPNDLWIIFIYQDFTFQVVNLDIHFQINFQHIRNNYEKIFLDRNQNQNQNQNKNKEEKGSLDEEDSFCGENSLLYHEWNCGNDILLSKCFGTNFTMKREQKLFSSHWFVFSPSNPDIFSQKFSPDWSSKQKHFPNNKYNGFVFEKNIEIEEESTIKTPNTTIKETETDKKSNQKSKKKKQEIEIKEPVVYSRRKVTFQLRENEYKTNYIPKSSTYFHFDSSKNSWITTDEYFMHNSQNMPVSIDDFIVTENHFMLKYHEEKDSKNSEHHFLIFDFEKDFCSSPAKITFSQPFNQTCISQTKENLVFVLNSDSLAVLILNSATTNFVDSLLLFGKFELAEFFYQTNNWDSNTLWSERAINLALDYQDYSLIERALSKFPFEKQLVIIQKMISYTNSNFSKFRPNFLQNLINLFQQKILLSISQYSEKILAFFPLPNENVNHLNLQQILILFASNLDNSLSFLNTNHSNQEKMQMELHKISQSNSNALILRKISNMIQIHPLSIVEKPKKDSMEELQQKMNEQIFHFVSQSILSSEEFHTYSIPQFISQFISSGKFSELISILQFYKNQENPLNLESFFRKEIDFISNLKRFSFEVFYHLVETNQVKEAFDLINNCQIKKESDIANELLLFTKNSVVRNNLLPFLYKDLPNIQSINPFNHDSIQNDLNFLLFLSHYYPNEDYLYYFELKTQKNYTEFPEIWDIIMQKAFIFSSNLEINFQPKLEIEEDFSENLNCGDLIEKSHLQFKDILNDKSEETLKEITQEGYFAFNLASLQNIHLNKRKRIVIEALNFQEETFTRRMSFFENIENQQEWLLICLDYIISHGNVFELKHFLSYIDDNYELNSKEIQAIQLYFSRFAPHFLRILFQKWFFKLSSVISYSQNYLDLQYLKLLCYHSLIFSNNQKKMEKLNHFRFKIHQLFVNLCIENQLINGVLLLMKHSPISQELKNHLISFLSKQTQSSHIQYLIQIIEEKFDLILLNDAKQEISDLLNQKSGDSKDQKAKLLFASFILSQNPKSQREKVSKMIEKSKQKKLISFFCTKSFLEKSKRNKMKNSRENHLFTSRNDTSLSQLIKKINSLEIDEILSKSNPFEELKSFSKQKFDIPFYLINTQTIKAIKTIVMNQEKSKMEIIMQKLLKENEQFWFQITSRISHLNLLDNKVFSCCLSFISFCGFSEAKFIVNHSSSKIIFIHIYAQEIDKESPTKKEYSFSPKRVSSSIQKIANLFKPLLFNDSKSFKKHKFTVYEKLLQAKTWIEKNKQNMEPFIENGLFLRSFCDKEILDKIVNNFSKIYSIDSRIFSKMGNKYTRSDLENVCQSLDFINRNSDSTVNLEENIQNVVLKDHIKRFLPELFPNSKTIEKTSVHKQDDISSFSVENIINWALREKDSTQMLKKSIASHQPILSTFAHASSSKKAQKSSIFLISYLLSFLDKSKKENITNFWEQYSSKMGNISIQLDSECALFPYSFFNLENENQNQNQNQLKNQFKNQFKNNLFTEDDRLLVLKNIILFAVIELKMTKLIVSAFEIFDHGNVIIDFFRFVHGYLQSNNTIGNRNKKFIENFVIQRKKVENGETNFGLIGNYDWINSITDQILHHLLTNSHKYQLHLLMKCLSQVKYNENYRIYFIFANLLGDVNSFDFETFQKSPKEICNNFLEKNEFGKARKVYQAINKPLTPIIIHQIEFILSENKQSWNQTSEYHHKQIFQRCFDLLNKYSSNYFVNAVFFLQKLHLFQSTIQASEIQQLLEYFLFFIQKFHSKNFQSSNSPFINRIERDIQMRITIFKAIQKNSSLKIPRLIIKILAEDFPFEKKIEENPPVLLNNEELPFYFLGDIFVKQNDIENEMIIVKQIIEYLIDENQVKQAEEICQEISCSLADLVVIKACERIALCSQDEYVENLLITEFPEVMSLVEKAYPHLDFSLITTDELLEKLKDLPNHGKKYCRKISTVYHVSLLVSRDFFVVEQAPELALQLLMRKSSNYSNEISRFSNDVGLSCTRLATIFADLYFESLIFRREIMGILLEKEMKEESPDSKDENKYQEIDQIYSKELNIEIKTEKNILRGVVSATHTTQEFIRFAQITGELLTFTNVLMRNLLNFISQKHENFDHKSEIEVEILIKCLECFRISCDMNGMKNNIKLIKKRLPIYIREQKHQLLYWIFQEYDLPQLDFLLHFFIEEKKLKKIVPFSSNFSNSFSIRASRYLQKKFSREPKLILNFYLHFSMKKEIGHFLSNEARLLLNQIKFPQISEQDPLTIFVSVQDIQKMVEARSILLFSSHAFLHTEFQQKLIQNFILDDLISIQILVGDLQMINIKKSKKKDLQILMQKAPDFYTSLVISEFYKLNSLENWSKALFHHFFVEKDSRFLSEYFSYFILDEPLVKKIVELYQSFSDKNLIVHQMEVFVSFIQDIVLALKISKELRFFNLFDNLKSVLPLHLVKEVIKNEKEKK